MLVKIFILRDMVQHPPTSVPLHSPGPRGEVTRQRILAVARELFAQRGFEATTVRQISGRLDISDPALYYYFRTKRSILEALMVEPDEPQAECPRLSRVELLDLLHALFLGWAKKADVVRILFREQMANDPASKEFRRDSIERFHAKMGPILREMFGERASVIAATLQALLFGMLCDAVLSHGDRCAEVVGQEIFRARALRLIDLILPADPRTRFPCEVRS